jgi:DNA-binding CsgD family transcriptional regulator/PAS domain-containing protein
VTVRTGGRLARAAFGDERLVGFARTELAGRPAVEVRIPNWVLERQEQESPAAAGRTEVDPAAAGVAVSRPGDDATHLTVTAQAAAVDREGDLLREAELVTRSGSWELAADTGHLRSSANLRRIFGLGPADDDVDLDAVLDRIHPADRPRVAAAVETMREQGTLRPLRYRVVVDGRVRHLRSTLGIVERDDAGRPLRLVGAVRDVTEQWEADQQVAAHMAVSEALAVWEGLEPGAERLLETLADALDGAGGVLWTEEDDALVARVVWADPYVPLEAFWTATHETRLRRGVEVAGTAWVRGEPVFDSDGTIMRRGPRHAAAREAGLPAVLAIPAMAGDEVVAVVEVPLREDGHVTDALMRSLGSIGHELGQFLGRRRGLLGAARLSARELEVLQRTARGLTTQQTAAELFIGTATVKTHLAHVYAKLDAADAAEAVATAMRLGLIA